MRIARVSATPLRVPLGSAPYATDGAGSRVDWNNRRSRTTPSRTDPCLDYAIVSIETDDGAIGTGEAQADIGFFGNTLEQLCSAVDDYLGPQLIGRDPFDRELLL